jgi:RNA polymerase sigma-70 factor (ECF subfamily)
MAFGNFNSAYGIRRSGPASLGLNNPRLNNPGLNSLGVNDLGLNRLGLGSLGSTLAGGLFGAKALQPEAEVGLIEPNTQEDRSTRVAVNNDTYAERAIIERCRKQDAAAFGQFVDLYQGRVFGFIRRMVSDADEAADVTQEVFIRAFQHFNRFDGRSSVKTWLFKIAHNLCVDYSRKHKRTISTISLAGANEEDEAIEVADVRWEPEQVTIDAELADAVEAAISQMSEKLRSVLILHDREDMAYEEIGAALNIPVGTVKSRLFLARNFLKGALAEYLDNESAI